MRDDFDGEGSKTKTTVKKNLKKRKTKVKISAIDSLRDSIDLTSLPSAKNKKILSGNKTRNRKDSMTFIHHNGSKSNSIAEFDSKQSQSVTKKGVALGKIDVESDDDNITLKHESQKDSILQQQRSHRESLLFDAINQIDEQNSEDNDNEYEEVKKQKTKKPKKKQKKNKEDLNKKLEELNNKLEDIKVDIFQSTTAAAPNQTPMVNEKQKILRPGMITEQFSLSSVSSEGNDGKQRKKKKNARDSESSDFDDNGNLKRESHLDFGAKKKTQEMVDEFDSEESLIV